MVIEVTVESKDWKIKRKMTTNPHDFRTNRRSKLNLPTGDPEGQVISALEQLGPLETRELHILVTDQNFANLWRRMVADGKIIILQDFRAGKQPRIFGLPRDKEWWVPKE